MITDERKDILRVELERYINNQLRLQAHLINNGIACVSTSLEEFDFLKSCPKYFCVMLP